MLQKRRTISSSWCSKAKRRSSVLSVLSLASHYHYAITAGTINPRMRSLIGLLLVLAVTSHGFIADSSKVNQVNIEDFTLQQRLESDADLKDTPWQRRQAKSDEFEQIKTYLEDIDVENNGLISSTTNEMFLKAVNLSLQEDNVASLRLLKQVYAVRFVMYGDENVDTLETLDWIAVVYDGLQQRVKALYFWLTVLEKRRYVLGSDHEETMQTINNVGASLNELGRNNEALVYLEEATERRMRILGLDTEETLLTLSNKANVLEDLGQKKESLALFKLVLEKRKKVLGKDHKDTMISRRDVKRLESSDE